MKNLSEKQLSLVLVEKFFKISSKTLLSAVSKLSFLENFGKSSVALNSGWLRVLILATAFARASGAEEKVSCVKNAVKTIVIDVEFAKKHKRCISFHPSAFCFPQHHCPTFPPSEKNCEKKCSKISGRGAISGDRHKPKPTFRNSTHSPRLPIAYCRQFSATLRSINIQIPKKLFSFSAAHFNIKIRAERQQFQLSPEKIQNISKLLSSAKNR